MIIVLLIGCFISSTFTTSLCADATDPAKRELHQSFDDTVRPFLTTYCFDCHGAKKQEGKSNLSSYSSVEKIARAAGLWDIVLERLEKKEMPPEEAKRHPPAEERRAIMDWLKRLRKHEAQRHAGDPGPVLARRLSNAEYDNTIHDLTGVDIRPTQEFPLIRRTRQASIIRASRSQCHLVCSKNIWLQQNAWPITSC